MLRYYAFLLFVYMPGVRMFSKSVLAALSENIRRATNDPKFEAIYASGGSAGGSGASIGIISNAKNPTQQYFVKMSSGLSGYFMLQSEYEGIKEMLETDSIRVPTPICVGTTDYNAYAVFEKLNIGGMGDASAAGK